MPTGVYPRPTLATRLARKIEYDRKTGCWLWAGATSSTGYGQIGIGWDYIISTHRLSWELHRGKIPEGLYVLHRCDVRNCINPDHLFIGTAADNTADMIEKGRAFWQQEKRHR